MHDFAGCRMIFGNLGDLQDFRDYIASPAVMKGVKHELRYPRDKYDYIEKPKFTGYRGIHEVFRHLPRGSDRIEAEKPWDAYWWRCNIALVRNTLGQRPLKFLI